MLWDLGSTQTLGVAARIRSCGVLRVAKSCASMCGYCRENGDWLQAVWGLWACARGLHCYRGMSPYGHLRAVGARHYTMYAAYGFQPCRISSLRNCTRSSALKSTISPYLDLLVSGPLCEESEVGLTKSA